MIKSKYSRTVLDNGLRVVTESMPYLKSVTIGIWIDVGSRDETTRENGISHFIEHMCFKGTETRSPVEIAQSLESLGGTLNAFTSREHTCYYCRILDEHFDLGFDVLSDIVAHSTFDVKELAREKEVICEEIKDVQDTPADLVHDYFAKTVWDPHPLGQSIMGEAKGIKKLKRTDLINFISKHYTADRIVVAAAGAVDHDQLVNQTLAKLKVAEARDGSKHTKPVYEKGKRIVFNRKLQQTHVCLGFPSFPFSDLRRMPILILNTLLGSGMGSRLFQSVREKRGLVYTIYSYQDFYRDTGLYGLYLGTDASKANEAVNIVLEELAQVKDTSITEEEVDRAKSQLKGNLMLALEGSYSRMNRLARHELFLNKFVSLDQSTAEINAVTLDQVREVAREIFVEPAMTMVAMGPVKPTLVKEIDWSTLS